MIPFFVYTNGSWRNKALKDRWRDNGLLLPVDGFTWIHLDTLDKT